MLSKEKSPMIFVAIMFFLLCFIFEASAEFTKQMPVFHFQINKTLSLILICLIFIAINVLNFYKDRVTTLLIISAMLGLVPLFYMGNISSYLGNYLPLLISLATYFVCLQTEGDITERFYKIIILVSLVISFQVIYTEWHFFSSLSFSNFSSVVVKGSMNIPIGSSNLIAAILLPMMVFIFTYKRNFFSFSVLLISVYALVLCRSKNALILLLALLILISLLKIVKFIYKDKSVGIVPKMISLSLVACFFGFLLYQVQQLSSFLITELSFNYFSNIADPTLNKLDKSSSGRISVYIEEIKRFTQHPFLGNGFGYNIGQTKSHNWILDLLVQKGVIGLLLYFFSIGIVLKTGLTYHKDVFIQSITISLIVILFQGLFEISVFTIGVDFLVWSMAGLLMARVRYLNSIVKTTT